jgi:hypothetical protein
VFVRGAIMWAKCDVESLIRLKVHIFGVTHTANSTIIFLSRYGNTASIPLVLTQRVTVVTRLLMGVPLNVVTSGGLPVCTGRVLATRVTRRKYWRVEMLLCGRRTDGEGIQYCRL